MRVGGREVREGDVITIDGATGEVMLGEVPTVQPELVRRFRHPDGLGRRQAPPQGPRQCRDPGRLPRRARVRRRGDRPVPHRAYVLRCRADRQCPPDDPRRQTRPAAARRSTNCSPPSAAISSRSSGSWPACRSPSACSIRRCTNSCRISEEEFAEVARASGLDIETLRRRAAELAESNPMLGHRGCRLGITYPEIYEMQARAIFEAALDGGGRGRGAAARRSWFRWSRPGRSWRSSRR